jgi:excinuclease UvrABC ATPase subunit
MSVRPKQEETSMMTRTANPAAVDDIPGTFDVADGGVYVRIGDLEIAVTSRKPDDPITTYESVQRAIRTVTALGDSAEKALVELHGVLNHLGMPCTECAGIGVQAVHGPREEADCPHCGGTRMIHPAAA